jgi:hypothetical protein
MSRKRHVPTVLDPDPEFPIVVTPSNHKFDPKLIDSGLPLPGDTKRVNDTPLQVRKQEVVDQFTFANYTKALVRCSGDPVRAIAELRGLTEEEVAENLDVHLTEIRRIGAAVGQSAMIDALDVGFHNRLAVIHESMYSNQRAARLKAVEMMEDIEKRLGSHREGQRIEDLIRLAVAEEDV